MIRRRLQDELEWQSPENLEAAASAAAPADPAAPAQQQVGEANNIVANGGVVRSVTEISNAVSGDAGPDSRGFPESAFPVDAAIAAETAELSDTALKAAEGAGGGAAAGLNGEGGGVESPMGGVEGDDAVARGGGEGSGAGAAEMQKDDPPPFLEEFEEVELQVRFV